MKVLLLVLGLIAVGFLSTLFLSPLLDPVERKRIGFENCVDTRDTGRFTGRTGVSVEQWCESQGPKRWW